MTQKPLTKRKDFLVFGKPVHGTEEIQELVDTIQSGWWGTGRKTRQFEQEFAEYIGSPYTLAVNSCTAGLHLALAVLGIGSGDEVITTPLTFCSTANVIIHTGATPIFADVDPCTWNIDPKEIEKKITKKTKAIIPVHLHGRPADMKAIMRIARRNKLKVIEDAAHAIESVDRGKKIGTIGDITVFSFYATKNLATAEGGMISTKSKKLIDKMRVLSLHGLSKDAYKRYQDTAFTLYECLYPGFKYNMTDLHASLGLGQLNRIRSNLKKRETIWNYYNEYFYKKKEFTYPADILPRSVHARHLYAILINPGMLKISRNRFIQELLDRNIGAGVHFHPVHLHAYYRKTFGFKKNDFPNAENIGDRFVSLPITAGMTKSDVLDVTSAVEDILRRYTIKK